MTTATSPSFIHVHTRGFVTRAEVDYTREKVEAALRHARDPVLFVRAKLTHQPDPALARPALVQVNVNLNGRILRAQVAAATMQEAADEAADRIRDLIERAAEDWEAIRGDREAPEPHEWRHGDAPTRRKQYFPRPVEERQLLRHKTFALGQTTVEEAAFDMEALGYEFYLFTEQGSGSDSVLYRAADGSDLQLSQLDPRPDQITPGATAVSISPDHPPVLQVEQAIESLNITGWPFVFFQDAATDRGCILYHRYDGHYGLITPVG